MPSTTGLIAVGSALSVTSMRIIQLGAIELYAGKPRSMTSFPTYDSRGHTFTEKRPWVKRESTTMTLSHSSLVEESDETMQLIRHAAIFGDERAFPELRRR